MRRACAGFTLVELLVVLALAGLLGAAVLLALPDGRQGLGEEAERLATRLVRARQEAILGARAVSVVADGQGHAVEREGRDGWTRLDGAPFDAVSWRDGTHPVPAGAPVRFRFDATGGAEPATLVLARDEARIGIVVDAAGGVVVDDASS